LKSLLAVKKFKKDVACFCIYVPTLNQIYFTLLYFTLAKLFKIEHQYDQYYKYANSLEFVGSKLFLYIVYHSFCSNTKPQANFVLNPYETKSLTYDLPEYQVRK
jgi:hypothetical protein